MTEEITHEDGFLTVDGKSYETLALGQNALQALNNLAFVDEQILQKNNELQISDSARIMYSSVLMAEITRKAV